MKLTKALLTFAALALAATSAFATGTLYDNGILGVTFLDGSNAPGSTKMSGDNDGTYIWTCTGGYSSGYELAKYDLSGNFIANYDAGIDYRSIFTSNGGQLYAKAYCGGVYSLTQSGVPTYLYTISDADCQSAGSFNGDDSELMTMVYGTVYRYNAANGASLGNFGLIGYGAGNENNYPDYVQMETNEDGRILTYSGGVVSEWDYAGNRVGQCSIAVDTPNGFDTIFSFGVGNDNFVYIYNEANGYWETYDVGLGIIVATENTSWSQLKALY